MGSEFWLAIGLLLMFEGIGPLFFPNGWRRMLSELFQQPNNMLRRIGGALFVAGLVISFLILTNR